MNTQNTSDSILNEIEQAFGLDARYASEVTIESWGVMVHIMWGEFEGWYDVHFSDEEPTYFIEA